jgi:hypothetical protein
MVFQKGMSVCTGLCQNKIVTAVGRIMAHATNKNNVEDCCWFVEANDAKGLPAKRLSNSALAKKQKQTNHKATSSWFPTVFTTNEWSDKNHPQRSQSNNTKYQGTNTNQRFSVPQCLKNVEMDLPCLSSQQRANRQACEKCEISSMGDA